jgi:hypothetical protein
MCVNKILYIDYYCVKALFEENEYDAFIHFLEGVIILPSDSETYYYIIRLTQRNKKIKRNIKKLNN